MENNYSHCDILLVEDNPAEAELARRAFKHNQITNSVYLAADGEEALNLIYKDQGNQNSAALQNISLIILDINIPKINGLEVLKIIKQDERTKIIPTVILTNSEELSDIHKAYEYGANSYLVKPQDYHQFIEQVATLGKYWLSLNKIPATI